MIEEEQGVVGWVVTKQHINNCQTSAWIDLFRPLSLKTIILPLPFPLVQRLAEDGVQVASSVFPKPAQENDWEIEHTNDKVVWEELEEGEGKGFCSGFEEFEASVKKAVDELGGVVVPKLTWSCPIDALFVSCEGNLKCRSVEEIFLLLQCSDLVVHDLCHAFDYCGEVLGGVPRHQLEEKEETQVEKEEVKEEVKEVKEEKRKGEEEEEEEEEEEKEPITPNVEHSLVLKKWANLQSGREMRCFIFHNQLKGICQRDPTAFFSFLVQEKEEIKEKIVEFYQKNIEKKFFDPCFVMDVYVDKNFRVWLLDINPFSPSTKPLLFDWVELTTPLPSSSSSSSSSLPEVDFRIVESQRNIQMVDTMLNRVPLDMFDVESAQGFKDFISMCQAEEKQLGGEK